MSFQPSLLFTPLACLQDLPLHNVLVLQLIKKWKTLGSLLGICHCFSTLMFNCHCSEFVPVVLVSVPLFISTTLFSLLTANSSKLVRNCFWWLLLAQIQCFTFTLLNLWIQPVFLKICPLVFLKFLVFLSSAYLDNSLPCVFSMSYPNSLATLFRISVDPFPYCFSLLFTDYGCGGNVLQM